MRLVEHDHGGGVSFGVIRPLSSRNPAMNGMETDSGMGTIV
jgi:hypothetical protein